MQHAKPGKTQYPVGFATLVPFADRSPMAAVTYHSAGPLVANTWLSDW
jgi:hypothetical protein